MNHILLSGPWTLERISDGTTCPAALPGDNLSALIQSGLVPDPYIGTNELAAQWVGREDWAVHRQVTLTAGFLKNDDILLVFESVDTVAEFWVNGRKAGESRSMFLPVRLRVKPYLQVGVNELRIILRSPEKAAAALAAAQPHPIPHAQFPIQSPHRNLLRKAQCHAGWDWGTCLMVSGVYGSMALVASKSASLVRVWTETIQGTGGIWTLKIKADVEAVGPGKHILSVAYDTLPAIEKRIVLAGGAETVEFEMSVMNPEPWNPGGYGTQRMYNLKVGVGGDHWSGQVGFRTLVWETKDDQWGRGLTCVVNGRPVFAKGVNWIPADALPSRWTEAKITARLEDAAAAHMNMIRVWGGGV